MTTTSKNKPQGNVLLFCAWECAKDPMLREFTVNTDPDAGPMHGCKPYSIPALVVYLKAMYLPKICLFWYVLADSLSQGISSMI